MSLVLPTEPLIGLYVTTNPRGVPTTPVLAVEVPVLLLAVAENVYAVLLVSPVIVQLVAGERTTHVPITVVPSLAVTV